MKISLRKIGKTPLDFHLKSDKVDFKGNLHYTDIVSKLITHEEKDLMIKQINKNIK